MERFEIASVGVGDVSNLCFHENNFLDGNEVAVAQCGGIRVDCKSYSTVPVNVAQ